MLRAERIQCKKEKAFEQLVNSRYQMLMTIALKWIPSTSIAEEVVQDVFISIWEMNDRIDSSFNIDGYLVTCVKNRAIDFHRQKKREMCSSCETIEHSLMELWIENSAISNLSFREIKSEFYRVGSDLPPQTRRIFYLSRYHQMNYSEIAGYMDVSIKTVEYHISKALQFFKKNVRIPLFWIGIVTFSNLLSKITYDRFI